MAVFIKTTKLKVILTTQIGGPYKTTNCKVVLTTQIGGSYKTKMWSYINNGSNCATLYIPRYSHNSGILYVAIFTNPNKSPVITKSHFNQNHSRLISYWAVISSIQMPPIHSGVADYSVKWGPIISRAIYHVRDGWYGHQGSM